MVLPPRVYQFLVGVFAAVGSFLYGYDLTIVAEGMKTYGLHRIYLDLLLLTDAYHFTPTTAEIGLVASLLTAGAFVGAAIAGTISDYFGRRGTILSGGLVFCLGGGLQTGAQNYNYVISGRFIGGIGIGILTMIVPLYQAELAHPDIRGLVTGLQQFMLGVGGVCGAWISYGTYVSFSDDRQWQIPFGLQIAPAGILSALIFLFPESPRWLLQKGKDEQGLATLARLHSQGNTHDPWVMAEFQQIQLQVATEAEAEAKSLSELFRTRANFRRVMLACAIQAATQMTGISAIQYYSVTIFVSSLFFSQLISCLRTLQKQIGINGTDTLRYQAINSVIGLIGEIVIMAFVDKVGRRIMIIVGNLAMCVTYIVSTVLMAEFPASEDNSGAHWGFIIMTWLFNFCFASMGSLSWIVPAEIFDTATRAKGVALATMTSFAFKLVYLPVSFTSQNANKHSSTMIGQVTPIGMQDVGWRFYILFVVTNLSNAIFFWAMLPETRKLPLEEMNRLFSDAPLFVGSRDMSRYTINETSEMARNIDDKQHQQDGDNIHIE
ncbi:hypothetical protein LCI18_008071 [Fusarium solani-melongenae]|uniref:Uncharacterized protein n=1 Tax=Fusarium solani subsp. cucurbitae TaxID=2747967 RepID=A0ACD3Z7F7_FUSSC|nr:hypothetical protein LCI18_008071 [Fusarium solani-melongenae]